MQYLLWALGNLFALWTRSSVSSFSTYTDDVCQTSGQFLNLFCAFSTAPPPQIYQLCLCWCNWDEPWARHNKYFNVKLVGELQESYTFLWLFARNHFSLNFMLFPGADSCITSVSSLCWLIEKWLCPVLLAGGYFFSTAGMVCFYFVIHLDALPE